MKKEKKQNKEIAHVAGFSAHPKKLSKGRWESETAINTFKVGEVSRKCQKGETPQSWVAKNPELDND